MSAKILIQITDTHLLADPDEVYSGWNTDQSLNAVLDLIRRQEGRIDTMLATGDLVHDESPAGYHRLHAHLTGFNVPVLAMPGNHDDPTVIASVFNSPMKYRLGSWQIWLLNSHQAGQIAGQIDEFQLDRLSSGLREDTSPALVAVHHPPVDIGTAWLDSIGLVNSEDLWAVLKTRSQVRIVLCGHVHQAYAQSHHGIKVITTPSTCRKFTPGADSFSEDTSRTPGYRRLALYPQGDFDTRIYRLDRDRIPA